MWLPLPFRYLIHFSTKNVEPILFGSLFTCSLGSIALLAFFVKKLNVDLKTLENNCEWLLKTTNSELSTTSEEIWPWAYGDKHI